MKGPAFIKVEALFNEWYAWSSDPSQGEVRGSKEVVMATVDAWMRGER